MYLPALTDDEILSYAEGYAETPLERELTRRFTAFRDEVGDKDDQLDQLEAEVDRLEDEVEDLNREADRLKCDAASLQDELSKLKGES